MKAQRTPVGRNLPSHGCNFESKCLLWSSRLSIFRIVTKSWSHKVAGNREHNFEFPQLSFCLFEEKIATALPPPITGVVSPNQTAQSSVQGRARAEAGDPPVARGRVLGDPPANEGQTRALRAFTWSQLGSKEGKLCCLLSENISRHSLNHTNCLVLSKTFRIEMGIKCHWKKNPCCHYYYKTI